MFIILTAQTDASTATTRYSYRPGKFSTNYTFTGTRSNASQTQGYLAGLNAALAFLAHNWDHTETTFIDVLIDDAEIAQKFSTQKPPSKILHGDDHELWTEFFKLKGDKDIRFVSNIAESPSLLALWAWSALPPQPAESPRTRAESDRMLASTKGQK